MDRVSAIIVGAYTVILVFGGAITLFAYQAFTRTESRQLEALAVGFGLITGGTLTSIALYQFALVSLLFAVAVQSISIAAGFVVMAYSLQSNHGTTRQTGQATK
ncbi:hypothetical protein ACFQL3_07595 [Natronoarchaeum sp. GCM10025321]|uniref:DUF7521 family protein n=1 Tax=unclassified Natronoarchaeum TaxID=2620183 RepID=UPI003610578C